MVVIVNRQHQSILRIPSACLRHFILCTLRLSYELLIKPYKMRPEVYDVKLGPLPGRSIPVESGPVLL